MAPLTVQGLKIAADAHGERNLIEQMTIELPSIGNIAIIDSKHVYRCCLDGRSKQKSWMMPIRYKPQITELIPLCRIAINGIINSDRTKSNY